LSKRSVARPGYADTGAAAFEKGRTISGRLRPSPASGRARAWSARQGCREGVAGSGHVIAQGQENAARANLSFIERALFASAILEQGHSAETVRAALGIDETTFSKMRSVSGNIPAATIRAIGAARNTGRDRWWQLSKLMEQKDAGSLAEGFIQTAAFQAAESATKVFADIRRAERRRPAPQGAIGTRPELGGAGQGRSRQDHRRRQVFYPGVQGSGRGALRRICFEQSDRLYEAFRVAEKGS
jgi:ParB family chromosome partitioning protein